MTGFLPPYRGLRPVSSYGLKGIRVFGIPLTVSKLEIKILQDQTSPFGIGVFKSGCPFVDSGFLSLSQPKSGGSLSMLLSSQFTFATVCDNLSATA